MAMHTENMPLPSPRDRSPTALQLPGVHELLNATFPRHPGPPLDRLPPAPLSLSPPAGQHYSASKHYPEPATVSPRAHPLSARPVGPTYLPLSYHTSPPAHYDSRPPQQVPFGSSDIYRRDSARPGQVPPTQPLDDKGIRQQLIPGRGPCWVYSDGSVCPVSIDGEIVNPLWGTTKAGKARKRLAQACLSCREKKIRCEPQYPRCTQCEKAKRECIMASSHAGQDEPSPSQTTVLPIQTTSPTVLPRPPSAPAFKRRRSDEGHTLTPPAEPELRFADMMPRPRDAAFVSSPTAPLPKQNEAAVPDWHIDPYQEDAETTLRLLSLVFTPSMTAFNHMLPRHLFREWVIDCKQKRPEETMVLYTMLALGCAMSKDQSDFAQRCLHRATQAMEKTVGKWSVMLAQARLNMAHTAFARGQPDVASDYIAAAIHVMRILGLTTEDGCLNQFNASESRVFGMNAHQVAEAKRRTLWAAYIAEQIHMEHIPLLSALPEGSVHLRHPCPDEIFERGLPSRASFFESSLRASIAHSLPDQTTTSPLSFMTEIAHLIGSQRVFASLRLDRGQSSNFAQEYADFLHIMEQRLSAWLAAIPTSLRMTEASFRPPTDEHRLALSMSVTSFYHVAIIHITRFAKHATLSPSLLEQNIRRADQSAQDILHLADSLCSFGQDLPEGQILHHTIPPTLSYALALAIDTVCAGGSQRHLRRFLNQAMAGCTILDSLRYVWPRAHGEVVGIERRMADLQELERNPAIATTHLPGMRIRRGGSAWRAAEPVLGLRGASGRLENDAVYGADDEAYLRAVAR